MPAPRSTRSASATSATPSSDINVRPPDSAQPLDLDDARHDVRHRLVVLQAGLEGLADLLEGYGDGPTRIPAATIISTGCLLELAAREAGTLADLLDRCDLADACAHKGGA